MASTSCVFEAIKEKYSTILKLNALILLLLTYALIPFNKFLLVEQHCKETHYQNHKNAFKKKEETI